LENENEIDISREILFLHSYTNSVTVNLEKSFEFEERTYDILPKSLHSDLTDILKVVTEELHKFGDMLIEFYVNIVESEIDDIFESIFPKDLKRAKKKFLLFGGGDDKSNEKKHDHIMDVLDIVDQLQEINFLMTDWTTKYFMSLSSRMNKLYINEILSSNLYLIETKEIENDYEKLFNYFASKINNDKLMQNLLPLYKLTDIFKVINEYSNSVTNDYLNNLNSAFQTFLRKFKGISTILNRILQYYQTNYIWNKVY
jgi:hypothetical protein